MKQNISRQDMATSSGVSVASIARMEDGEIKSFESFLRIEVGMQNSGLATSLAATHFAMFPLAAVPGAIFSAWHNFSGSIAAAVFRRIRMTKV